MQKKPGKGIHSNAQERWPHKDKAQVITDGEVRELRKRLETLLQEISQKNLKVAALLKMKAGEAINLKNQIGKAFKKTSNLPIQKALVKANMELSNHLHHVERELGVNKMEVKRMQTEAKTLAMLLRKKFQTVRGPSQGA